MPTFFANSSKMRDDKFALGFVEHVEPISRLYVADADSSGAFSAIDGGRFTPQTKYQDNTANKRWAQNHVCLVTLVVRHKMIEYFRNVRVGVLRSGCRLLLLACDFVAVKWHLCVFPRWT